MFKQLIKQILLFVFALVMLYPILWMIASSLRGQNEIFKNMGLLVTHPIWSNYVKGWNALSYPFSISSIHSSL